MADGVNAEAVKPGVEVQGSRAKKFVGWLKQFGKSKDTMRPPATAPEVENKPAKSLNELLRVKEADQLELAPKLLFHTTPVSSFEKLKAQGLFSQEGDPMIGNNIGYSAFFASEHHSRSTGKRLDPKDARTDISPDYMLTIWKTNDALRKETGAHRKSGFFRSVKEPPPGTNLDDYVEATIRGSKDYEWFGSFAKTMITQKARMVDPGNYLTAIRLDQSTRNLITKNMLLAKTGVINASQIEESFKPLVNSEDISHGIAASIEQTLIRNTIMGQIEQIKTRGADPRDTLLQVMFLRTKVNDRVSAFYLDKSIKWLIDGLDKQGVDTRQLLEQDASIIDSANNNPQVSGSILKFPDPSNSMYYYGSDDGVRVAEEIRGELKLAA